MSDTSHRRERLREQTLSEIKTIAHQQLVEAGPASISLRAIAREMGMTAPALYRYFPSLDVLVLDLCTDLYHELRLACAEAAGPPESDPLDRLLLMAREFRRWVLAHPAESALVFGPPTPGVDQFTEQCRSIEHAGAQFGRLFLTEMIRLHEAGRLPSPPAAQTPALTGALPAQGDLPTEVTSLFLLAWTRIYGLIAAEVFGHLRWAVTDAEPLFEAELAAFAAALR